MQNNKVYVLKKLLGMIMVAPVALSLSLFAADPVNHWELDETAGSIYEDTGTSGDADGTCTSPDSCPTPSDGQIYDAQSFDGNDTIEVANTANFDWAADANVTIEFWMKMTASDVLSGDNDIMIGRTSNNFVKWYVGIAPGGLIRAGINDGVFQGVTGSKVINNGKWNHIAYVLKPGQVRVYVNGENDFNITRGGATDLIYDTNVTIGNLDYPGGNWAYIGNLDDIKLYTTDLNGSTIKEHYMNGFKPHLREVTPVPTPTDDDTPSYTFSTDKNGTIEIGGSCSDLIERNATVGNKTITFDTLADDTYNDCTITVTSTEADSEGNVSDPLAVSSFVVDTVVDTTDPGVDTTVSGDTVTTSSGGGGGCTYNPNSKNFDMTFLLMMALGLLYPFRRRFIK